MRFRRLVVPIAVVAALTSVVSATVLYVIALQLLADGPTVAGYDLLLAANRAAVVTAVLVAGAGVLLALHRGPRIAPGVLLLGSAASWGVVAGLESLGTTLARVQQEQQPLALSSMFSAMIGSSAALVPVPCILLVGAVLALASTRVGRPRRAAALPAS